VETARLLATARCGWAVFLLCCPDRPVRTLTGITPTEHDRLILRVLGARQLVQAAISLVRPSHRVLTAGSAVDALHAATCLGLVAFDVRWRRGGLIGALDATAFALAGYASANRAGVTASAARR
jgi:hypothetical protein